MALPRLVYLQTPKLVSLDGTLGLADLPLRLVNFELASKLKHAFDLVVLPADHGTDFDAGLRAFEAGDANNLLEPFAFGASYDKRLKLQAFLLEPTSGDTNTYLLKHMCFETKVLVQKIMDLCKGKLLTVDYGGNFRSGPALLRSLVLQTKGCGIVICELQDQMASKKATKKAQSDLQRGFDWIRDEGPRSNCNNRQTERTEIEIHREDSPIFGWSAGLVEKSLKGYASSNVFAEPVTQYYLTLKDLQGWFLDDVLIPLLPDLKDKSLVFMGLAEKGKTPAAQAIAMAFSEYWILVDAKDDILPSFRLSNSLDHLRGEPGIKYRPDILDDADVSCVPVSKIKAFLDMSLEESFTVERWTAAKLVRNQLRIVCAPGLHSHVNALFIASACI